MNPKYPSPYKHAVFAQQYQPKFLLELFALADKMRTNPANYRRSLEGRLMALLFYKPSTRTRFSFGAAMLRLGGQIIETENAEEFSSAAKGETLEDTIRVVSDDVDAVVLRHDDADAPKRALSVATVPIINAGCGSGQHPTQALLDAYTIYQHFRTLENLDIALVGDLWRGRTCRSLAYLFSLFPSNRFLFVSPENLRMQDDVKAHLNERGSVFSEHRRLDEVLRTANVIYMTRAQSERPAPEAQGEVINGSYMLCGKDAELMPHNSIIMHPLPRNDEIARDVDGNPRAKYFEQAANGMWIRMALLYILLGSPAEKH